LSSSDNNTRGIIKDITNTEIVTIDQLKGTKTRKNINNNDCLNTPMLMEKFPDVNIDPMQAIRRQIRTEIDEMYPNNKKKDKK
jgi:hypothetical protein